MRHKLGLMTLLMSTVLMLSLALPVLAQTPFDAHTTAFGDFIRLNLGPLLVMVLIIVVFLGLGLALHSGPMVLLGIVIGMVMIIGISAAINGTALTWLGISAVP